LLEHLERSLDRAPVARGDEHAHRTLGGTWQADEVEADVLGRKGNVPIQLEGHHLAELRSSRRRQLQSLDGDERPRQSDPHPADLDLTRLQLVLEPGAGNLARFEREALEGIASPSAHDHHELLVAHVDSRPRRDHQDAPDLVVAAGAAGLDGSVRHVNTARTGTAPDRPTVRCTMTISRARGSPPISPWDSIRN